MFLILLNGVWLIFEELFQSASMRATLYKQQLNTLVDLVGLLLYYKRTRHYLYFALNPGWCLMLQAARLLSVGLRLSPLNICPRYY